MSFEIVKRAQEKTRLRFTHDGTGIDAIVC